MPAVEISEFMAKNDTVLATAAGLYEDWIEIHNDSGCGGGSGRVVSDRRSCRSQEMAVPQHGRDIAPGR